MNKLRRVRVLKLVMKMESRRSKFMLFKVRMLAQINDAVVYLNRLAQKIRGQYLKRQTEILVREFEPIVKKCQLVNSGTYHLSLSERELIVEGKNKFANRSQPLIARMQRQIPIFGRGIILYAAQSLEQKHLGNMKKREALKEIISQKINDPTFYYTLVLWLIMPVMHMESGLGDLDEEYELRRLSMGDAVANAWYQNQVTSSVKSYLLARLERFVAIGSVIEWIFNFLRKQH